MSFDATPTDRPLTGILIPDPGLEVWDEYTTIGQSGARVGRVTPSRPTSMRIVASGTPTGTEGLALRAVHPGAAGGVARLVQSPGAGGGVWRGRDDPTSLGWWEHVGNDASYVEGHASVVRSDDGAEVMAYEKRDTGTPTSESIVVVRRKPEGGSWSTEIQVHTEAAWSTRCAPRLIRTESGRLDIYLVSALGDRSTLVRYSSTDHGATWELSSSASLLIPGDTTTQATFEVAEGGGQALLLVNFNDDGERYRAQYASADGGASFELVSASARSSVAVALQYLAGLFVEVAQVSAPTLTFDITHASAVTYTVELRVRLSGGTTTTYDVAWSSGASAAATAANAIDALDAIFGEGATGTGDVTLQFPAGSVVEVVSVGGTGTVSGSVAYTGITFRALQYGSAFTALDPAGGVQISSAGAGVALPPDGYGAGVGLWADDSGILWALLRAYDEGVYWRRDVRPWCSADSGATWSRVEAGIFSSWGDSASESPWNSIAACWGRGCATVVTTGGGVYAGRLGGWSSRTRPWKASGAPDAVTENPADDQLPWLSTYVPVTGDPLSDASEWTFTPGAGYAETVSAGSLLISGPGGALTTARYDFGAGEYRAVAACRVAINPSSLSGMVIVEVASSPALPAFQAATNFVLYVEVYGGELRAYDSAGDSVGDPVDVPATPFELVVALGRTEGSYGTQASAYVAYRLLSDGPDEEVWTVIVEDVAITETATSDRSYALVVVGDGADPAAVTILRLSALLSDSGMGWEGASGADRLRGALVSRRPTYVRQGVSIAAEGTCRRLDSWTMAIAYAQGFDKADPLTLSDPRRGWRAGETDEGALAYRWASPSPSGNVPRGGLFGIYLDGQTYGSIAVDAWTGSGSGAWVELIPLSTPGFSSGEMIAQGATVESDQATPNPEWFDEDELSGSWWVEGDGSILQIVGNSEGPWAPAFDDANFGMLRIDLEDEPNASQAEIVRPRVLILVHVDSRFRGFRLRFDTPLVGDPGVNVIAAGRVRVLGSGWDETRALARELGSELVEGDDGSRAEVRRRADRRRVELSLVRGTPLTTQGRGDHGFVRAQSGGEPVGGIVDPATLGALVAKIGRSPIVYLPEIPVLSGTASTRATMTAPRRLRGPIYGRFVPESYRLETVQGYAESGCELVRTSVVTIEEEIG